MSIVSTEVLSDTTSGAVRSVVYRCTDSDGGKHDYGPVMTVDPAFDADEHMTIVEMKVASRLAEQEANEVIG